MLSFRREADDFLPHCLAQYFYRDQDTVLKVALYEWDIHNDITNLNTQTYKLEQQLDRLDDYTTQYKNVMNAIVALIGQPTQYLPITKTADLTVAKSVWVRKNQNITLDMAFTAALQTVGATQNGKFRVRLKVEYKN